MRIAVLTSLHKRVSFDAKGGTELFAYLLVEELVKRGHQVTLFATADSQTSAKLIANIDSADIGENVSGVKLFIPFQLQLVERAVALQDKFDIIHNSFYENYMVLPFLRFLKKPAVTTVHNDFFRSKTFREFFESYQSKTRFIFVSQAARQWLPDSFPSKVIYNGIDVASFKFNDRSSDYLFWLSRVDALKGIKEAILTAKTTGSKLVLSGAIGGVKAKIYFENEIAPLLDKERVFVGPCDHQQKIDFYKNAKAFIFPVLWEEPFGLVMAESMASGTPVVAFARGAVPEVIKDGETGFIVNSSDDDIRGNFIIKKTGIDGLCEATKRIYSMPEKKYRAIRHNCRLHVEKYFTIEKMVDKYEEVYQKLIDKS